MFQPVIVAFVLVLSAAVSLAAQTPSKPAPRPPATGKPALPAASQGMSNDDVVKMVKAGLGEGLIIAAIRQAPARAFVLTADGLVELNTAGVSEGVIRVMLDPTAPLVDTAPAMDKSAPAVSPVVVKSVTVPDGTEVHLRLLDRLSSATAKVGDRLRFESVDDVVVAGTVVIAKGAAAVGNVFEANPKKSFGRSGKIDFTIDAVKAVDGDNLRLRTSKENKGSESYGKAGVVTALAGPFGALVRGKDVEIAGGTEYTIYIDGDRTIQLNLVK